VFTLQVLEAVEATALVGAPRRRRDVVYEGDCEAAAVAAVAEAALP